MKLKYKLLIGICFIAVALIFMPGKVEAKSYSIEDMDMQVYVQDDGTAQIKHRLTYKFNGEYNGIYITVPFNLDDTESKKINSKSTLGDSLYTGKSIDFTRVVEIRDGGESEYKFSRYASNGDIGYYTVEKDQYNDAKKIKVYSHTYGGGISKTFDVYYTINDLCVKHNDVAELYYNFIGGKWEEDIKKLNIDIYLPESNQSIRIWGHGPQNGESKIISNTHANFKVSNVKKGQYVATRIMFDKEIIANAKKISNVDARSIIFEEERNILENREKKQKYTNYIWIAGVCLLIYWIILIRIFEKDRKYILPSVNEEELFKKYNPMIAGCIQGSRNVLARDIIAVLLNLVNKKIVGLEVEKEGSTYEYTLIKIPENENRMDEIEKYVYDWFFGISRTRNFKNRLQEMPKESKASDKFKELSKKVDQELANIKANEASVPFWVRGFNMFLFLLSIFLIVKHVIMNFEVMSEKDKSLAFAIMISIASISIIAIPGLLVVGANLIIMMRHRINKVVQRITGQKVVTTTIALVLLFGIIILITALIAPQSFLIADEFLIGIATIIILTDNLMLKNNAVMIGDYSKLNTLKQKIQKNTLLNDKNIEHVILWEKYLCYAISFGISKKIISKLKGLYLDDDLELKMLKDIKIMDFITSDYYHFYRYASLDRVYVKRFQDSVGKFYSKLGDGGSGGRRRRILWWWRIFWRRRRRPEAGGAF